MKSSYIYILAEGRTLHIKWKSKMRNEIVLTKAGEKRCHKNETK